jgi:hypothetical protein
MSKVLSTVALVLALGMIAAVGVFDPGAISRGVNQFWGWKPNLPGKARLVPVERFV